MQSDAAVGKRVEKLRTDALLSQEELSEKLRDAGLNWSQGTLSRVETGSRPMRFVEALIVAAVLRVEVPDLTPFGGGLTYAYHRRVQILEENRWAISAARHNLRAAEIGAQLFKFAVELSQGSKARYVLRIPPENFIGHIQYQLGISPASDEDVLLLLGASPDQVRAGFQRLATDFALGYEPPPPYAPSDFAEEMAAYGMPDLGTPEFDEKQREAHYLLTLGMVGEIFRQSFPQVEYEYPEPPPSVISEWPLPIVAGIDTTDLEQPLRQPPVVRGARRGW